MYKFASNQYCCSWTLTTLLSPQQQDAPLPSDAAQRQFPSSSSIARTSDLSGAFVPSGSTSFPPNDEMDVRWSCDHQRTLSSRLLLVTDQATSRRSTQGHAQERGYERKEVPSSNEGEKERLQDKQIGSPPVDN